MREITVLEGMLLREEFEGQHQRNKKVERERSAY